MKYPLTIEVYHEACDEIRGWMTDWLSQHEFDRLSAEHRPQQSRVVAFTGDTIFLPLWRDPNLGLLQEMQKHGIVEAVDRGGTIYYRAKAE